MSHLQVDLARSLMNVSAKLDRLTDYMRPQAFKTHIDGVLLTIAAAIGTSKTDSGTYNFQTLIKKITVCPNRYDEGDYIFFIINGNEYPEKDKPLYAQGYGTTPIPMEVEFDGDLPVCPQGKPIEVIWNNGAAQAKKISVTFKRLVQKP